LYWKQDIENGNGSYLYFSPMSSFLKKEMAKISETIKDANPNIKIPN
jgi:hypothetical protein